MLLYFAHMSNTINKNPRKDTSIPGLINTERVACGSPAELIYNLHRFSILWVMSLDEERGSRWHFISALLYFMMLTPPSGTHHRLLPAFPARALSQINFPRSLKPQSDCRTVALDWSDVVLMSAKQWDGDAEGRKRASASQQRELRFRHLVKLFFLPFLLSLY